MPTSLLYHGWGLKGYRHVRSHYGGGKLIFSTTLSYSPVYDHGDLRKWGKVYGDGLFLMLYFLNQSGFYSPQLAAIKLT